MVPTLNTPMRLVLVAALAITFGGALGGAPADAATARHYANCKALNAIYRHGVGLPGARDHTSGTPVTNFTRNQAVYKLNKTLDRDKDGIACEKH